MDSTKKNTQNQRTERRKKKIRRKGQNQNKTKTSKHARRCGILFFRSLFLSLSLYLFLSLLPIISSSRSLSLPLPLPLYSNAHWFSRRTSSSSSGVKSFGMLKVLRISSGVLPLIMLATVRHVRSSSGLMLR